MGWETLGWQAWMTLGVVGLIIGLLACTRLGPDLIMLGGLVCLLTAGILSPRQAFSGLANPGVITVAALFGVAAALRETGLINMVVRYLIGRPKSLIAAQARIMAPVAVVSAFLNNTPLVATLLPAIDAWAKQNRMPITKLLLPLSYAAILGGMCTLIGTSSNLIVNGLLIQAGLPSLKMFDISAIGMLCAIVGLAYILVFSRWLLPERCAAIGLMENPREYTVEMLVDAGSSLDGQTIEQAGLRHLPGLYLMEINRGDRLLVAVSPHELLQAGDRLIFVGVIESVVDLQKVHGLTPATNQLFKLEGPRTQRCLIEAVVSNTCPLVGKTIREGRFRTIYSAVVIAVARNGERLRQKVGDIVLCPGDTLLLEASAEFELQQRNSPDFFLVSQVGDSSLPRHNRSWVALLILIGMVLVVALGWLSMLKAAMIAGGFMLLSGCCSWPTVKRSMDLQVLLVIATSIGIGKSMEITGMAGMIAQALIDLAGQRPWIVLAVVYGVTLIFTEILTNTAAAVLVFPIAMATAQALGVSLTPFVIVVMVAASASFATPLGYQTNLMVYGPGGYRFGDYLRIGIPLDLLIWGIAVTVTPWVWPFHLA